MNWNYRYIYDIPILHTHYRDFDVFIWWQDYQYYGLCMCNKTFAPIEKNMILATLQWKLQNLIDDGYQEAERFMRQPMIEMEATGIPKGFYPPRDVDEFLATLGLK